MGRRRSPRRPSPRRCNPPWRTCPRWGRTAARGRWTRLRLLPSGGRTPPGGKLAVPGQPPRERDHVGALRESHHLAHRRAFHAARARSEQRLVARELVRGRPRSPSVSARAALSSPCSSAVYSPPRRWNLAGRGPGCGTGRLSAGPAPARYSTQCGQLNARHLLLHGLGLGLAAACGLRPFLPLLLAGALASSSALGISFSGAPWTFLQEGWWLLVVAIALVLSYAAQILLRLTPTIDQASARSRPEPFAAALAGIGLGAGAVLFRRDWPRPRRMVARPDRRPAGSRPRTAGRRPGHLPGPPAPARPPSPRGPDDLPRRGRPGDGRARVPPGPLGYVAVGLLLWLALGARARSAEKFAGLRILRR